MRENTTQGRGLAAGRACSDLADQLAQKAGLATAGVQEEIARFRRGAPPDRIIRAYYALNQEQRLYEPPDWLRSLSKVTEAFLQFVDLATQGEGNGARPAAVFFDETEFVDLELADWIEEWIINPLAHQKRCVIVWTARRPWRWKRPEIRRRIYSEALGVFEQEEVQQQLKAGGRSPDLAAMLFQKVFEVTGGHPYANAVVIEELDTLRERGEVLTKETFSTHEPAFLREIFYRFIRDYAFRDLDADAKIACELLALVRSFDTTMLREVLQSCAGDRFARWSQEDFGDLLLRLKRTQLLVWDKGYSIDPPLRRLIREYFYLCEPETYWAVNRAARRVYQNWLERPVDNRAMFIMELLYHQACLNRGAASPADLGQILQEQLEEYRNRITDLPSLLNALDRMEGDLQRDPELERLIGGESRSQLASQIGRFAASLSAQ